MGKEETRAGRKAPLCEEHKQKHSKQKEDSSWTQMPSCIFNVYMASGNETILTSLVRIRSLAGFKHITKIRNKI